jgi:hypothetical protein
MGLEMQREEWTDVGQDLYLPGCPKGIGGNVTLVNQHEDDIIPMSWESIPCEETGYAENFSHTQGVYNHGPYMTVPYDRGASPEQMEKEHFGRPEEEHSGY